MDVEDRSEAGTGAAVPHLEYERRESDRLTEARAALGAERRLENVRLGCAGLVAAALVARGALPPGAWRSVADVIAVASLLVFVFAVLRHRHWRTVRRRFEVAAAYYRGRRRRMDLAAVGEGDDGVRFLPENHPYAAHLDILGSGSIFELLSDSMSESGRATLASWLLEPATPDRIARRQAAVKRLVPEVDLRERRALEAAEGDGRRSIYGPEELEALADWAEALPSFAFPEEQVIAIILTGCTVTALAGLVLFGLPGGWLLGALAAQILYWIRIRAEIRRATLDLELATRELLQVSRALSLAVGDDPSSAAARAVLAGASSSDGPFDVDEVVETLGTPYRLMLRYEWMGNMFFWPFGALVMWGTHHAMMIDRWRVRRGARVREWIRLAGELEALLDLSAHGFEHPDDAFPVVEGDAARFEAVGLCHPLLAEAVGVRNDISLDAERSHAILSVTGANMSGKSTLLRSVGAAAVLAQAGAPVRAYRLDMSPARVAASIRNQDSLADATSHFYAELKAIRRIVQTAGEGVPLLFLMDEVMGGTDSGDREVGVVALIGGLLEARAVGIVTTHDRRLAGRLHDEYPDRVRNVHLAWEWVAGDLRFPFKLEDGLNPSTNAIELMRSLGLEVDRPG